ncbi:hypothetical protein EV182_003003 [Spiromyces aspiralis]|uniref:Uncharacterized protein n=1 Tax=Spiromyces aspiralis TaxID=68401 RepID=A0ACC1HKX5_9FUNG|nr:hypothetical protein EV182_003003 [Spiromyces aspiralis]
MSQSSSSSSPLTATSSLITPISSTTIPLLPANRSISSAGPQHQQSQHMYYQVIDADGKPLHLNQLVYNEAGQPIRRKRAQVKNACVNCQKACKKCDDGRPCQRCIKYGLQDTCQSSKRKERKKGIKRGPYKKRTKQQQQQQYTPLHHHSQPASQALASASPAAASPAVTAMSSPAIDSITFPHHSGQQPRGLPADAQHQQALQPPHSLPGPSQHVSGAAVAAAVVYHNTGKHRRERSFTTSATYQPPPPHPIATTAVAQQNHHHHQHHHHLSHLGIHGQSDSSTGGSPMFVPHRRCTSMHAASAGTLDFRLPPMTSSTSPSNASSPSQAPAALRHQYNQKLAPSAWQAVNGSYPTRPLGLSSSSASSTPSPPTTSIDVAKSLAVPSCKDTISPHYHWLNADKAQTIWNATLPSAVAIGGRNKLDKYSASAKPSPVLPPLSQLVGDKLASLSLVSNPAQSPRTPTAVV